MGINEKHGSMKCWEFKKCGVKEKKLGACPAYPDNGRICWYVAGTLCDGKVQDSLAKKKRRAFPAISF